MGEFNFSEIEKKAKEIWAKQNVFRAEPDRSKPKYYVLDMFPYPSGAGLHVGHPLGYIGSDIIARYKRLKGFNVLHPMGYDSFGLPAEQYAIQTGQHPAITTEQNIKTFRGQMDKLGFSFDWSREVRTSDSKFYKWTQWIFIQWFHSWYNKKTDRAEKIETLTDEFEKNGNSEVDAVCGDVKFFSGNDWKTFSAKEKSDILLNYRIAYLADSIVNWCPALGTVLANDEVKDGVSERGGYPVERKLMKQWSLRITAYAERLLQGLEKIEWSEAIKESQRNWIGRSEGCSLWFEVKEDFQFSTSEFPLGIVPEEEAVADPKSAAIEVFTTRPDTIFGATFITLAPEHELIEKITTPEYKKAVEEYVQYGKNRSERERMADVKKITGQFTGAYAIHPFSGEKIPIWIAEYVLAGYGTGAVMAVPAHDTRDYAFAKFFEKELREQLGHDPIVEVITGGDVSKEAYDGKEGICINSDFLNDLPVKDAIKKAIEEIEKRGIGKGKVNYKMRDAVFGRQRYWGEPIPIYYDDSGIPKTVDEKDLPVVLPEVDKYLPTESGEPPLARASNWKYNGKYEYELTTMPGWAGSNWYYLRYEDPENENEFASKEAIDYWQNVDFYIGGDEHATGHLLYFRFCTKFLYDLGLIPFDEPAKKLLNQGKIQGKSAILYRVLLTTMDQPPQDRTKMLQPPDIPPLFISREISNSFIAKSTQEMQNVLKDKLEGLTRSIHEKYPNRVGEVVVNNFFKEGPLRSIHVPINLVDDLTDILDQKEFKSSNVDYKYSEFFSEVQDKVFCHREVEKMSKSKYNVVNPDEVVAEYGADAFRMYEMFLGPIETDKPWDTHGIDGVYRFLKKFWKLFYDENGNWIVTKDAATKDELKTLHRTIKKVSEDVERLSFNTSVSSFMICVNELTQLNCHKQQILEPLLITLSPYAPFITEYLWREIGYEKSIVKAIFPEYDESLLVENSFEYPVAINGKTRSKINLPLDLTQEQVEKEVLSLEELKKYFDGKNPKKIVYVRGRMINVVV